jgi:pyruvate,water dikinase
MAEGIPGVQTPLSWSIWDDALDFMMREGYRRLGVIPSSVVPPATDVDHRLVAIFHGRSALNVDLFRAIADATPWTSREAFDEYYFGMARTGATSPKRRRRYPIVFARTLPLSVRLAGEVKRLYDDTRRWWSTNVTPEACADAQGASVRLRDAYDRFVRIGSAHSAAAQIAGAICNGLTKLCVAAARPDLVMTLLGGHESVEVETSSDLWSVARDGLPLEEFLARHGFQGPLMGELSSPSWREDPSPVVRLARTYETMSNDMDPRAIERERVAERKRAEEELLRALGWSRRVAANAVFAGLHAYIPCREFGKAAMMMAFDGVRGAANTIGADLAHRGVLADARDVYFLTLSEIQGDPPADVRRAVSERRTRWVECGRIDLPHTWTGKPTPIPVASEGAIAVPSGIGVSPGVVEGVARVITDLREDEDLEPGEILVCETTDPSWAAYFLVAGGVVTDLGGAMSHGAIVSREVGIPCVVNTKTGTKVFRTGDRLRIDGATGAIERLAHAGE